MPTQKSITSAESSSGDTTVRIASTIQGGNKSCRVECTKLLTQISVPVSVQKLTLLSSMQPLPRNHLTPNSKPNIKQLLCDAASCSHVPN